MLKIKYQIFYFFIILYSTYCAIFIGQSWDEGFHIMQGKVTLEYLFSLGKINKDYFYKEFYSPIYWTIQFFLSQIISLKYQIEIIHIINLIISLFTAIGLSKICRIIFNKDIEKISLIVLLLYPIFFGHAAMNGKDTILAFSHVWIFYFILQYLKNQFILSKKNKYIYFLAFVSATATGIQLLFFGSLISIFLFIIIEIIFIKKFCCKNFNKNIFLFDLLKFFFFFYLILVFFWIGTHDNIATKPIEFFIKSLGDDIWRGWPYNLINGNMYLANNLPSNYFILNIFFKSPEYILFLYLIFFIFFLTINNFFKNIIKDFNYKLIIIISVLLLPIGISIFSSLPVYDGLRLFIWVLPYFCIIPSLMIFFLYKKLNNLRFKIISIISCGLFIFYIFNFILITPYHYTYLNSFTKNSKKSKNFENDYWGISIKELINNINIDKKKLDIAFCGVNTQVAKNYLKQNKNKYILNFTKINEAEFIIMTNRVDIHQKSQNISSLKTCYDLYPGKNINEVKRIGNVLSVFRQLN